MKVYLPTKQSPSTGKGLFLNRLLPELRDLDVEVTNKASSKCDISLHLTTVKKDASFGCNIVRYDGIYHNTSQDYKAINDNIRKKNNRLDAIIYQSRFGQHMVENYIRNSNVLKTVIFNGADPNYFDDVEEAKSDYEINILAFARWRPHKRLKPIIKSFLAAGIPNSNLWIAGDLSQSGIDNKKIKKYFSYDNVNHLGGLSFTNLSRYIKAADAIVHLCWLDWCPNSVVESICASKTVICNNVGGTHEIVGPSNGIVCDIDKHYDCKPVELYHPPKININIVVEALMKSIEKRDINTTHVDIKNIAKQYKSFFLKALER